MAMRLDPAMIEPQNYFTRLIELLFGGPSPDVKGRFVKAFVAYAAPLVSFIAALTALLGPSRRPDQIGLASLTGFGWAAAAFAVIGLAFTLYNANAQQKALRKAEEQLRNMRRVAQSEFQDGMQLILDVLTFAALMPYTTEIGPSSAG